MRQPTANSRAVFLSGDVAAILDTLVQHGFPVYLWGFSAIDAYLGRGGTVETLALTGADAADLAKIFEETRYPGIGLADVAVDRGESACYFRCADFGSVSPDARFFFSGEGPFPAGEGRRPSFKFLEFYQDWLTGRFFDPQGIYPLLRQCLQGSAPLHTEAKLLPEAFQFDLDPCVEYCRALMDWALILSRNFANEPFLNEPLHLNKARLQKQLLLLDSLSKGPPPGLEEQRLLLSGLMTSPNPGLGLEFLKSKGFIEEYWPELAVLDDVDHSKEFHPEGNVWKHTL
ncbi:MAG: hypothetical protein LBH43_19605, partial [Treponema sp.]|nr:hypothetical protein [Treponema sp.]